MEIIINASFIKEIDNFHCFVTDLWSAQRHFSKDGFSGKNGLLTWVSFT